MMDQTWKDRLRRRWRILRLKTAKRKLRLETTVLKARRKWIDIKIGFWKWVATRRGVATPEQSEALTGIEVENDGE